MNNLTLHIRPGESWLCAAALLLAADIAKLSWLRIHGARIFETL